MRHALALTALLVAAAMGGQFAAAPAAAHVAGKPPQCEVSQHGRLGFAERMRYAEARKHFWTAVRAFNDMKSVPIEQSPLWRVLDPNVAIYDFDSGNQIMASGLESSVYYLYNLPTAKFDPIPRTVCVHLHSNPQTITGQAYWTGNDGSGTEKIFFTWELNHNLIASMKGWVRPPAV